MTAIYNQGYLYSVHNTLEEAEKYLDDLLLVNTTDRDFEIQDLIPGRVQGEEYRVWCSIGAIDFQKREVHGVRRVWRFPRQIKPVPVLKVGDTVDRFLWLTVDETEQAKFEKRVKHLLKLEWKDGRIVASE